jgi:hypothetical protein
MSLVSCISALAFGWTTKNTIQEGRFCKHETNSYDIPNH